MNGLYLHFHQKYGYSVVNIKFVIKVKFFKDICQIFPDLPDKLLKLWDSSPESCSDWHSRAHNRRSVGGVLLGSDPGKYIVKITDLHMSQHESEMLKTNLHNGGFPTGLHPQESQDPVARIHRRCSCRRSGGFLVNRSMKST